MSRAAVEASRSVLKLIAKLSTEPGIRAIAEQGLEQLEEHAADDETRREKDRRRKRLERGQPPCPLESNGHARTERTDVGGVGGGVSPVSDHHDLEDRDPPVGVQGEGPRGHGGQVVPLRRYPSNATDDGAGGFTVSQWQDAVRVVTGGAMSPLAPGEQRKLVGAIITHGPKSDPRALEDWARSKATDYASTCLTVGMEISVWGFARWCDNGFQHMKSLRRTELQPHANEGGKTAWKFGDDK